MGKRLTKNKNKTTLCTCSQCIKQTYWNTEACEYRPGQLLRAEAAQRHRFIDGQRLDCLENAVLRETLSEGHGSTIHDFRNPTRTKIGPDEVAPIQPEDTSEKVRDTLYQRVTTSHDVRGEEGHQASAEVQDTPHQAGTTSYDVPAEERPNLDDLVREGAQTSNDFLHDETKLKLLRTFATFQSGLVHLSRRVPTCPSLVFNDEGPSFSLDSLAPSRLDTSRKENAEFITYRDFLKTSSATLRELEPAVQELQDRDIQSRHGALHRDVTAALDKLAEIEDTAWTRHRAIMAMMANNGLKQPPVYNTDRYFRFKWNEQPVVLAVLFLVTVLHSLSSVSFADVSYILATIKAVVYGVFLLSFLPGSSPSLSPAQQDLLDAIPLDIRTVLKRLSLEPECTLYACCPKCLATYPPDAASPTDPYPHTCTRRGAPDQPECATPLVVSGGPDGSSKPVMVFPSQSLRAWIAQLLSRPGIERVLEDSWSTARDVAGVCDDILKSRTLQEFLGPDDKTPYSFTKDHALHLSFSLNVDWFNPFGNKQAGKSHSVGGIYLACLNLPPEIRYKPENVFLAGIIPGPREPSVDQLNFFLQPLVDELLEFWWTGVYMSRTAAFHVGRLVRAAIIPLVCDLPALRKVAGYASHSSEAHFCSFCNLSKSAISQIYNRELWGCRAYASHYASATKMRDAPDLTTRRKLFKNDGIRWSELLRLPYWDPTRFTTVDAMHNLFLGELKHHCIHVFGVNVNDPDKGSQGTSKVQAHTPEEQKENLRLAVDALQKDKSSVLLARRRGYLLALALLNDVPLPETFVKADIVEALRTWYKAETSRFIKIPLVGEEATKDFRLQEGQWDISRTLLTREELAAVRDDIKHTYYPSWVQKPPHNFGSPSHGKLRAAQWRSVCMISLVITLVRLWGTPRAPSASATPDAPRTASRQQSVLRNYLDLIIAVDFATRRRMTQNRVEQYQFFMYKYLSGLRGLFQHALVPNHHLSMHLTECLAAFGPVHGWWAFPFERYNGLIGRKKTNAKAGEMPLTFMRSFTIGGALRWLMSTIDWPNAGPFRDMMASFYKAHGNEETSIFPATLQEAPETAKPSANKKVTLQPDVYAALLARINQRSPNPFSSFYAGSDHTHPILDETARGIKTSTVGGLTFGTSSHGKRNSFVLFRSATETGARPGQISSIFEHTRIENGEVITQTFLAIKPFSALDAHHEPLDPYRAIPELDTRLYYASLDNAPIHIVQLSEVLCHFAAYFYRPDGINRECVVVRSLDQE